MAEVLEHGHIYFFYRPDVEEKHPTGQEDVQRLYMVLSDADSDDWRLAVVGRKRLPKAKKHERHWGFIDKVGTSREALKKALGATTYETKTRGTRHQEAARPVGEGVYAIAKHDDHTHLAYVLEMPRTPEDVQKAFNIAPQASYILTVKNPEQPSPKGFETERADYPQRLQEKFADKRFIPAEPVDVLDYQGTSFVLVGASDDPDQELGLNLQEEAKHTAHIYSDLAMRKKDWKTKPMEEGEWA